MSDGRKLVIDCILVMGLREKSIMALEITDDSKIVVLFKGSTEMLSVSNIVFGDEISMEMTDV
jgi:hypothetical protein